MGLGYAGFYRTLLTIIAAYIYGYTAAPQHPEVPKYKKMKKI